MIRLPKTSRLRKNAFAYNRKAFRKTVIQSIKYIGKQTRELSESGEYRYEITISDNQSHGWEYMIAFRWIRRFSGLNTTIKELEVDHDKSGRKYLDKVKIEIQW
jgi:hypothetical protein